jgi:hypothetical protein
MHSRDSSAHAALIQTARTLPVQAVYVRASQHRANQLEGRLYTATFCMLAAAAALVVTGTAFAAIML